MDQIAVKTLQDCMQKVFEDGPKRDRRLWIGDLRLQALTNYVTFKNYDLVKRCLYLFAGVTQNEGRVGACLFTEPSFLVDDTSLYDYSLFFVSCLYDYFIETKDLETLSELSSTAFRQIELAVRELDERGLVKDKDTWWCFIDWAEGLNKQASAQAILIYTLRQAIVIAQVMEEAEVENHLEVLLEKAMDAARALLWEEKIGLVVSGADRQISWASQVWFVLADILPKECSKKLMKRLLHEKTGVPMITPYMYHHFIEALIHCDLLDEAKQYMKYYWGGMIKDGADCFYELYDPKNPEASPYGSNIINSYCHAWSCTPAYFIRKYFATEDL